VVGDILQPTHLLFVLVVALLVLGPKRLPEVGRALGRGLRDFRSAISGEERQDSTITAPHDPAPQPAEVHDPAMNTYAFHEPTSETLPSTTEPAPHLEDASPPHVENAAASHVEDAAAPHVEDSAPPHVENSAAPHVEEGSTQPDQASETTTDETTASSEPSGTAEPVTASRTDSSS
jgi:sec-independent protein translocase protein TatA